MGSAQRVVDTFRTVADDPCAPERLRALGGVMIHEIAVRTGPHDLRRKYHVFISYSHAAAAELAEGLQGWMQRYAKPWWKPRALRVFRDQTDLKLAPELWPTIVEALDDSEWLLLVASPESSRSKWVKRELRHWLGDAQASVRPESTLDEALTTFSVHRRDRLLVVQVGGTIAWRERSATDSADFDWLRTDALPRCLSGVFATEPSWQDLRAVASSEVSRRSLSRSNPAFITAVARLSATVRDLDLAALIGEDNVLHRRAIRTAAAAVALLVAMGLGAAAAAWLASVAARTATWQRDIAAAERSAAEARALAALEPAALPQAALLSRGSYLALRQLPREVPAPSWLQTVLPWLSAIGIDSLRGLSNVTALRLERRAAERAGEIMRLADDLCPSLVANAALPKGDSVANLAFDGDSGDRINIGHDAGTSRWSAANVPTRAWHAALPVTRTNGRSNRAQSGDGRLVAIEDAEHRVVVRRSADGVVVHKIAPDAWFEAAAFEPMRRQVDRGGTPVKETFVGGGVGGNPLFAGLALNREGDRLALITRGGFVRLLALPVDGQPSALGQPWTLSGDDLDDATQSADWVLDDQGARLAASPSSHRLGRAPVWVWRSKDGGQLAAGLIHDSTVDAMSFSPDGSRLATGTAFGTVVLWRIEGAERERTIDVGMPVKSLAFGKAAAAGLLLVGGEGMVRIYDTATRIEAARASHPGRIDAVAWSADGSRFASAAWTAGGQPTLRLWALDTAQSSATLRMRAVHGIERLIVDGDVVVALAWPGRLHAWRLDNGLEVRDLGNAAVVRTALGLDAKGKRLLTIGAEGQGLAESVSFADGRRTQVPGRALTTVAYSDMRPFIAVANFDGPANRMLRLVRSPAKNACELEVWDLGAASLVDNWPCNIETRDAILSSDGTKAIWLVAGDAVTPTLHARSLTSRAELWSVALSAPSRSGGWSRVAKWIGTSQDGKRIVATSGNILHVFEAENGSPVGVPIDLPADAMNVALDASGTRAIASLVDLHLAVIDVDVGEVVATHRFQTDTIGGGALAISEANATVYAAFNDDNSGRTKVWRWRLELDRVANEMDTRLRPVVTLNSSSPQRP